MANSQACNPERAYEVNPAGHGKCAGFNVRPALASTDGPLNWNFH